MKRDIEENYKISRTPPGIIAGLYLSYFENNEKIIKVKDGTGPDGWSERNYLGDIPPDFPGKNPAVKNPEIITSIKDWNFSFLEPEIYGYIDNNITLKKITFNKVVKEQIEGKDYYHFLECTEAGNVEIALVGYGTGDWYSGDNLIKCNMSLRGVETKVEEPALQVSDVEIQAHVKDSSMAHLTSMIDNLSIYIRSGYKDNSITRKFYNTDVANIENNIITINGQDASKDLDEEMDGLFFTPKLDQENNLYYKYYEVVKNTVEELTSATVAQPDGEPPHLFTPRTKPVKDLEPINCQYRSPQSGREFIAKWTNILDDNEYEANTENGYIVTDGFNLRYVDAGIPTLRWKKQTEDDAVELANVENIKISLEPQIGQISTTQYEIGYGQWNTTEWNFNEGTNTFNPLIELENTTLKKGEIKSIDLRDNPCSNITVAGSTCNPDIIEKTYTQVTVKAKQKGTLIVKGRQMKKWGTAKIKVNSTTPFPRSVTIPTFYGALYTKSKTVAGNERLPDLLSNLFDRSNKTYEIKYRGNPFLQPRDLIYVDGEVMTIESITLEWSNGGLSSTITARGGII